MKTRYAWQQSDWRDFSYDASALEEFERKFLHLSGIAIGVQRALSADNKEQIKITFLSNEAEDTSAIEGVFLDRNSLQSSIQRYFQLKPPLSKNHPRENGIAQIMVDLYVNFNSPLTNETLCAWHQQLMNGRTDLEAIGQYRFHEDPMRIVSRHEDQVTVHYVAPPSHTIQDEMEQFINWFNESRQMQSPLVRAGIAHLYFELVHPFEDGNGRIGRALIEKSLAQSLGHPTLIAVSQTVNRHKKAYYDAIEAANTSNEITAWLRYFCQMVLDAQQFTIDSIEFLIQKTQFFDRYAAQLNERQHKLIQRIFREDLKGFTGGVSVKNYISINKVSRATANRDLNDLVAKGIMERSGNAKTTRYWLILSTDAGTIEANGK
ncbi:MAG: Fic family protein [Candidatus Promineifilaceae bacterium]